MVQVPVVPEPEVYGYEASVGRPLVSIHLKALSMRPPLQPWLPEAVAHETRSCSEREVSGLPAICHAPSTEPVVEKAQHEPHWPWFFTGVTAPSVVQSLASAVRSIFAAERSEVSTFFCSRTGIGELR